MKAHLTIAFAAFWWTLLIDIGAGGTLLEALGLIGLVAVSQVVLGVVGLWATLENRHERKKRT